MCNKKSLNEVINMNEQSKFKELVLLLAQSSECKNIELNKEITKFEDAIRNTGCGKAYFGIAKSDWEGIEIIEQSPYKKDKIRFYAEYYDGMQAPFTVCEWNNDFGKLETLLKNTSDTLYSKYQDTIEKEELS